MPALFARLAGAIVLGLIYQFYYGGGDTFNYFTHGSAWIWEAFLDDPSLAVSLLTTSGGAHMPETFEYSARIWYFKDPNSYAIVRIVAFFDVFTFHTYSSTALFFAAFSFSGAWAFFMAVCKKYPQSRRWMAVAVLFVPSTVFWGSGILKDTVTLGALGWLTFGFIHLIDFRNRGPAIWVVVVVAAYTIFSIKSYILICYIPTVFIWLYWKSVLRIKSYVFKVLVAPVFLLIFFVAGYASLLQISAYSHKYSLDSIAEQAAVTSYDIRYGWGARTGGDGGYDLGELDGTWQSMVRLMPEAINVSLFRPYLWEVKNPLMLISALESVIVLLLTLSLLFRWGFGRIFQDPFLVFCLVFALLFAFAVGVSTYNFGTLMRYKIPMMPFYFIVMFASISKKRL